MRLNDIGNQFAALNEIALRTREQQDSISTKNGAQSSDINSFTVPSNPKFDRQLEKAQTIASERAEQSDKEFRSAQSQQKAIAESSQKATELKAIITEAQRDDLSDSDRAKLQERFSETLSSFAPNPDNETTAAAAQQSGANDRRAVQAPPAADELGKNVNDRYSSLEALSSLDLRSASSDELKDAFAVAEKSSSELNQRNELATVKVNNLRSEKDIFAGVAKALGGEPDIEISESATPAAQDSRLERQAQAVQEMIKQFDSQRSQNPLLAPGSLFNFPA